MGLRVCAQPGCPELQPEAHCLEHRRGKEQARGTRQQRGYDVEHDRERARWAPKVNTGTVPCRRCRELIPANTPWDLGHPDADCPRPRAPEHQACNRAVNGR